MKKIKFKTYVAPWVLPNEDIPVHIIWDNDFEFSSVKIILPEDIILKEMINVGNYETKKDLISIPKKEIKRVHFPNFFGLVLNYTSTIEKLKVFRDIKICFYKSGDILRFETVLTAKIFRPKIINKSKTKPIILEDSTTEINVPLNLQCVGFGYVDLKLKALINKVQISIEKNIIEKIRENLEKKYKIIEDIEEFNKTEKDKDNRVCVNQESINRFFNVLDDYVELIKTKKDLEKQEDLKEKEKIEKKLTDFFTENKVESRFMIDFFIELFSQIKIRNKFENVLMRDSNLEIPHEHFNEYVESIVIYVSYKDLMDNEYNDVEIPLSITDLRSQHQNTNICFKVNIEDIKNDIFRNIEKIKRD